MKLNILTFNWHEGYVHLLAKTGYQFDVVELWKGGRYGWIREFRPVPVNCNLISENQAKTNLEAGKYNNIIAHNIKDLLFVREWSVPKVRIFHNKFIIENALGGNKTTKEVYMGEICRLLASIKNLTLVFISRAKREDWGLDGEILLPGIDLSEYSGWRGKVEKVLRVGNGLMERDIMLGYSVQERILRGFFSTVLGLNPNIAGSYLVKDWEEFKEFMRSHRVYINTTLYPYEDGYNLSMLEAMATGMPIVSIANPSSLIEDSVNGYISADEDYLSDKIKELLSNYSLAESFGKKATETVRDKFPMERFIKDWKRVLGDTQYKGKPYDAHCSAKKSPQRLKILMSYTSNPQTTAVYMEKALRKKHDVITYGPTISNEILKTWNLEKIKDRVKIHDIPYFTPDIKKLFQHLPPDWAPDLFLWVESGVFYPMEGFGNLPCSTACYLIDTHLHLERHLEIAKCFDYVFIAQKEYLPRFIEAGIEKVFWLPLACAPEIHGKKTDNKLYDIGFVGSLNNHRRDILNRLGQRFNVYYERCFLERMAEVFSQSKIVFNSSVRNDLNMRVFEALCSGSMLLTDEAGGSGLTEMFEDKKYFVVYRNEKELLELADYYLGNDNEREKISAEGMKKVLSKHTYEHRVKEMLDILSPFMSKSDGMVLYEEVKMPTSTYSHIHHPIRERTDTLFTRGERHEAIEYLQTSLTDLSPDIVSEYLLVDLLLKAHRIKEAIERLKRILQIFPEDKKAGQYLETLKNIDIQSCPANQEK